MGEKKRVVLGFVSGVIFAFAVMFFVLTVPKADADNGMGCMKQDLDAVKYKNTMPSPTIDLLYSIPACYAGSGYQMSAVSIYQGYVRVTYKSSSGRAASYTEGFGGNDSFSSFD